MVQGTLAANLKRLRLYRKQTQSRLAEEAKISVQAYRNLEADRSEPRVRTLEALAKALDVRVAELLAPAKRLQAVRFRAQKKLRVRDQVLFEVAKWLDDFNELQGVLGKPSRVRLPGISPQRKAGTDLAVNVAETVRKHSGLSPEEPIQDICGFLEENGVKVLTMSVASDAFFGLSVAAEDGGPAIVVNVWDRISVERRIFTAAHELGHLLLHREAFDVENTEEDPEEEKEADIFASSFLMPEEAFRREWEKSSGMRLVHRVLWVKRLFGVSYKTVLYRLHELGWRPNVWARFYYEYRQRYGKRLSKAEEPQALSPESFRSPEPLRSREPERLASVDFEEKGLPRLVRQALLRGDISMGRAAEILRLERVSMRELAASWVEEREPTFE